jgi:hypothetical protein
MAVCLTALLGCGETAGSGRLPVYGQLSGGDSQSLSGSISFTPAKGHAGLGGTCALQNGAYKFDKTNGPTAGSHDVIIRRTVTKPTEFQRMPGPQPRQEWNLKADVPENGPYRIDLTLD